MILYIKSLSSWYLMPLLFNLICLHCVNSQETPKDILLKANQLVGNHSSTQYTIEIAGQNEKPVIERYYEITNPDGLKFTRIEIFRKDSAPKSPLVDMIQIINAEGKWTLFNKKAIKHAYDEQFASSVAKQQAQRSGLSSDNIYTMAEVNFREIPCYQIKEQVSNINQQQDLNLLTTNPEIKKMLASGRLKRNNIPICALKIFYIGKNDFIIYGVEQFDAKGAKLTSTYYKDIKYNLPISESNFTIPSNYMKLIANTREDFIKFLR